MQLDGEDSFHWVIDGRDINGFSSSRTWEVLRPREAPKNWSKSIWFSGAILRQAFNMWLANLNRLSTKLRMSSWGLNVQTACSLCNAHEESRDHLFLSCSYSAALWRLIFARLDRHHPPFISWTELLSWMRAPSSTAPTTIKKLATQSLIYHTWRQRNSAIHQSGFAPMQTTFHLIDRDIRNVINARRHRRKFVSLMQFWIQ